MFFAMFIYVENIRKRYEALLLCISYKRFLNFQVWLKNIDLSVKFKLHSVRVHGTERALVDYNIYVCLRSV